MTSETHVRAAVIRWLYRHGYNTNLNPKEKAEHGVDIRVKHGRYARYFLIETKGDPIKAKSPDSSRTADVWKAIGQIVTRMNTLADYRYGVAFPASFRKKIKCLPWQFCKRNRLSVFLVDGNKVTRLTWRELREEYFERQAFEKSDIV